MTEKNHEMRRLRAAYHEAGHALLAVVEDFHVEATFLTWDTTTDGMLGGYTYWQAGGSESPEGKARLLYAGQCAEHELARRSQEVFVPAHDVNWEDDEHKAGLELAKLVHDDVNVEGRLRAESAAVVARDWRAIDAVARELLAPVLSLPPKFRRKEGEFQPESLVVSGDVVERYLYESRIAERAWLTYDGRRGADGDAIADWLRAQDAFGRSCSRAVRAWIADDNAGEAVATARFDCASTDAATMCDRLLVTIGFGLARTWVSQASVYLEGPLHAVQSASVIALQSGAYLRRRCGRALP